MKQYFEIVDVMAREILDSCGNPTVEVEMTLDDGTIGRAAVPSGGGSGACELRDGDPERYRGRGVLTAVENVNGEIAEALLGLNALDQVSIDKVLIEIDGTPDKTRLGANAILGASLACAKAAAEATGQSLYSYIGGVNAKTLPVPMISVLNGRCSSGSDCCIKSFMVMPVGANSFKEAMRMGTEVFHALRRLLPSACTGEDGGYAPVFESDEDALDAVIEAIETAGFTPGEDIMIAVDAAVSAFYSSEDGRYHLPKSGTVLTAKQLVDMWEDYTGSYPIISVEDGMAESDIEGQKLLTARLSNRVQIVCDDVFAAGAKDIARGAKLKAGNSVLIKPNRMGTLSETLDAVRAAQHAGWTAVISHRSGETEDTTIADIAVAVNAGQIKTGAPCGSDRVAKYNQLLRIEDELFDAAEYPGMDAFFSIR